MRGDTHDEKAYQVIDGAPPIATPGDRPPANRSQIVTGTIVLLVGFSILLDRADVIDVRRVWEYWPLLLVAIGVTQIIVPGKDGCGSGIWLIFVGTLLALHKFHILRLHDSWPLFIVAFGVSLVLKALGQRGART